MTTDYRIVTKTLVAYATLKYFEYWPVVVENMEAIDDSEFKTECPDKKLYASKCITKIKSEDGTEILKQEWIMTNCEKELELEENYNNKLRQRLA